MEKQQREELKQQAEAHKKKTAELCKMIRQQHQEEIKLQPTTYKQKTKELYERIETLGTELKVKAEPIADEEEDDDEYEEDEEEDNESYEEEEKVPKAVAQPGQWQAMLKSTVAHQTAKAREWDRWNTKHGPQKPKEIEQEDGKPSEDTLGKLQTAMKHLAPGNRYSAPKGEEQEASAGIVRLSQSTKQEKDAILPGLAGKEEKQGKNFMLEQYFHSAVEDEQSLPTAQSETPLSCHSRGLQPQWRDQPEPTRMTAATPYVHRGMNNHFHGRWQGGDA